MLSMIQYGADHIITSTESSITDEDIDKMLERAEKETQESNEKMKKSVLDFSEEGNLYEFEGVDFSKLKQLRTQIALAPISKRERKEQVYSVNQYYKNVLASSTAKKKADKPKKQTVYDFQFYDPRLYELVEKENRYFQQKHDKEKEKRKEEVKEEVKEEPKEEPEEIKQDPEESLEALTPKEQEEKESLLKKGFKNWGKREFQAFLRSLERHGRDATPKEISEDIESKSESEVATYLSHFWENYQKLNDWERIMKNLEKTESKKKRLDEMIQILNEKVSKYKEPLKQMKIVYAPNQSKAYTREEDNFLFVYTHKLGYGNWYHALPPQMHLFANLTFLFREKLKDTIRDSWEFRFDWFLKSRTPLELNRRVDLLIRCVEKENQDLSEKQEKLEQLKKAQKKKAPSNGQAALKKAKVE